MNSVSIYGFGSFFRGDFYSQDVDILVLHKSIDRKSIALAIRSKRCLERMIAGAHVTMLSESEERHFDFIHSSGAKQLGTVFSEEPEDSLKTIGNLYLRRKLLDISR